MQLVLRRLALALLLLASGAQGGVLKNLFSGIYDKVLGPECNKQCLAAAYAKAEVVMAKCDENTDGRLNKGEWFEFMAKLFHNKDEDRAKKEYDNMCSRLECNEAGVLMHKLKFIFQHKAWREALNRYAERADL
eukprot:CAMPEP_0204585064 /NCGR_PEP_ID=MMETSP0661-20131031/46705_1 /ASSEMBLY_ACC=CAM_ASM_000606 /TAXON_ID=109239 /ORGANISM="Alexandrium margalefi, Strain AMGDE01CS-322" /LENGTH=133 /DNA_ID=CAMNT_0051594585 /DNA_START=84 /DNA_END=485 /DNA_ORIENTATION=-